MNKRKISIKTYIMIFSLCLMALLSCIYIFQVKEYTQAGFDVGQYQSRLTELNRENKDLKNNFSGTNSLANLENLLKVADYQKVGQVRYIRVTAGELAAMTK